jgi:uncharacterized spore protein YtfJ
MEDKKSEIFTKSVESQGQAMGLIEDLIAVAEPESAFSAPVQQGEYTVITAAEVSTGVGFGYGMGGGTGQEEGETGEGYGGGGAGGGGTAVRPVAAVIIGPEGVTVEPIVDVTKVALAFFTALGAMFLTFGKMKKKAR